MKILIPTDFSETASKAVEYAAVNFGRIAGAELTLLHTVETPSGAATMVRTVEPQLRHHAEVSMADLMERVTEAHPDINWEYLIEFGSLGDVVAELTKGNQCDLVVMGTTGASGYLEHLIGSNASRTIHQSKRPVIAIPHAAEIKWARRIVFATDFRNDASREGVERFAALVSAMEMKVDILHVSTEEDDVLLESGDLPELSLLNEGDLGYSMHFAFEGKDSIEGAILNFAHINPVDMIATIPHHEGFFKGLFHKSISRRLTLHSDRPVMVVK